MVSSLPPPPYTPEHPPTISPVTGLAFWNTHVPPHLHTPDCPLFLTYAYTDHRDRACLATRDADQPITTWPDAQSLIQANRLDVFRRVPSALRRYREYTAHLVREHGSVTAFVQHERLHWATVTPSGAPPFDNPEDYKILRNDWPYALDPRIAHLVVWTKFLPDTDPLTPANPKGDLTPAGRAQIQEFVDRVFGERCGRENVMWFRNWTALKSVHALEHFHVLLWDPAGEFVESVTGGDVALAEKVGMPNETAREDGVL